MVDVDVVVVGGGPVGLYLGCLLATGGQSFVVLERRTEPVDHSRSIGIHPPLLAAMDGIGVSERLIDEGVTIRRGHGFWNGRPIGGLDFSRLPGRYPFVLSLPQTRTEEHLRNRLIQLVPDSLRLGHDVADVTPFGDRVRVATGAGDEWSAGFVIGCDGKHGLVREAAGFEWSGGAYPDRYLMGDFSESTDLGPDAALCLGRKGLVESFPLPSGERRWVVRLTEQDSGAGTEIAQQIEQCVRSRTPFRIDAASASMTSAFGVERLQARPMAKGRIMLAGDAAHVISPIGGQGMNLGWLDADSAAAAVESVISGRRTAPAAAADYARERARTYRKARLRAEFNMWMGRPRTEGATGAMASALKAVTARLILVPGIRAACARQFTMHGLGAQGG